MALSDVYIVYFPQCHMSNLRLCHRCHYPFYPDFSSQYAFIVGSVQVNFLSYLYRADTFNLDPKHGFLSSVEAEMISFCQIRQPFSFSTFYVHPFFFFKVAPHPNLLNRTLRLGSSSVFLLSAL